MIIFESTMYFIFVASDGTGRTAEQALDAALTQFEGIPVDIITKPGIRTKEQINELVDEASQKKAFIVHTLVSDEMRSRLVRAARKKNIETIDLMGPLLMRLSHQFANTPSEKPGLFHEINLDYFRRIEAMEYSFRHDDGQRTNELDKADIVLVGVSRTFKTPLSIYLSIKGWLVANVPIVLGLDLPSELFTLDPGKVVALTTHANRLWELRKVRHDYLGGASGDYAEYSYVRKELDFARQLFLQNPKWTVVRVTGKSIEEIASEILSLKGKPKI